MLNVHIQQTLSDDTLRRNHNSTWNYDGNEEVRITT